MRGMWKAGAIVCLGCALVSGDTGGMDKGGKQQQLLKYAEQRAENAEKELARVKAQNDQVVSVCEAAAERHEEALSNLREKSRLLAEKSNKSSDETRAAERKLFEAEKSMNEKISKGVAEARAEFEKALRTATAAANKVMDTTVEGQSHVGQLARAPLALVSALFTQVSQSDRTKVAYEQVCQITLTACDHAAAFWGKGLDFAAEKLPEQAIVTIKQYVAITKERVVPTISAYLTTTMEAASKLYEQSRTVGTQVAHEVHSYYKLAEKGLNEKIDAWSEQADFSSELPPALADRIIVAILALLVIYFGLKFGAKMLKAICLGRLCCSRGSGKKAGSPKHFHYCDKHKNNKAGSSKSGYDGPDQDSFSEAKNEYSDKQKGNKQGSSKNSHKTPDVDSSSERSYSGSSRRR